MLFYLLKSSACLAIFMLFYKLCLEKTSAHTFKRFYLLAIILISVSIPSITFTEYIVVQKIIPTTTTNFNTIQSIDIPESKSFQDYLPSILWSIYTLGVIIFLFRFLKNLYQIFKKIKSNPKYKNQNFINVLLHDLIHPHTFFNYIFLNKTKYEHNQIPDEVLLHEQTHAKQKHALDILFIEVLQIIFWFNPLLYFIKKDIKLNHEFLADQAVINTGFNTKNYQQLLLAFSSNAADNPLANAINYSLIKKRFTIMRTKTSKQSYWIRSFILLPVLAILIYSFSNHVTVEKEKIETNLEQDIATKEEVIEYNKLAKYYNTQPEDKRTIKLKDIKRLEYIYNKMSQAQKTNSEPFPNCPPPPPPSIIAPKAPNGKVLKMAHDLPPPPPIPKNATQEQKKEYQKATTNYKQENPGYTYKHKNENGNIVDVTVITDDDTELPPPPPPPKSTLEHVLDMAQENANFYYEGKFITSDKAIELIKNNKKLNIETKKSNSKRANVYITTKPIVH